MPRWQKGQSGNPAGKPKGAVTRNSTPVLLREMILRALDESGGVEYLKAQALAQPGPFLALIGKVLPTTLQGPAPDGSHRVTFIVEGVPAPKREDPSGG